jgi:hypothetical protein
LDWHHRRINFKNYSLDGHSNDRLNRCRIRKTIMGEVISGSYPSPTVATPKGKDKPAETEVVDE